MNSFLLFLIKSTLSLSLLYLTFSVLMRKETFFKLNRMVLLVMVLSSFAYSIALFAATDSAHRTNLYGAYISEQ